VTRLHACGVDHRLAVLRANPLFAALSDAELGAVNGAFVDRGFVRGERIYRAGQAADRLHVLADGTVKLVRHTAEGTDVLVDLLVPGALFGTLTVLGDDTYPETAEALTDGCSLSVDAGRFREVLARHPAVALATLDLVASRLRAAHGDVTRLASEPATRRVASRLVELGRTVGERRGGRLRIRLTRRDLAALTGTTPETVSRVLGELREAGVVATGRGWVEVVDGEGLARRAGD